MLPTPAAHDAVHRTQFNPVATSNGTIRHGNKAGGQSRASLSQIVSMWPTPKARDHRSPGGLAELARNAPDLPTQMGGKLNPDWVEWLMGWPRGATRLEPLPADALAAWEQEQMQPEWPAESVPRVEDGSPHRVGRIKALGNGQVPKCAATAFTILMGIAEDT